MNFVVVLIETGAFQHSLPHATHQGFLQMSGKCNGNFSKVIF